MPLESNRVLTIPNLLSLSRLALLPVWWRLMDSENPQHHIWAGTLIVYAMASDIADGWIARRWNQASKWGKFLDPVGDKIAAFVVGLFCVWHRDLPVIGFALTVTRDIALLMAGLFIWRRTAKLPGSIDIGRYAALLWGIVLLLYAFEVEPFARFILWPAVGLYLIAGILYARRHFAH